MYRDRLTRAMTLIGAMPHSVFVGQAVRYPGTAMFGTLESVPMERRVEFPVAENMQLGYCIGRALQGALPVCIYPRINFLLEATSQLVQHLDKLPRYSAYRPKVLIRTAIATPQPLDPGPQHLGDYTPALRAALGWVRVVTLDTAEQVSQEYASALEREESTVLVERTCMY